MFSERPRPIVLIIIDGIGVAPHGSGNAVTQARTDNLNGYWAAYPHGYLHASGSAVGLPHGVKGNSEVGHMNIGAGKVVFQELPKINNSITNQSFYQNKNLLQVIQHTKTTGGRVHVMGCTSTGNIHSSLEHAFAIIKLLEMQGVDSKKVFFHAFTDGRDSPPKSSQIYLEQIDSELKRRNAGRIASVSGRYYAMDRDLRWERTEKAYRIIAEANGPTSKDWKEVVEKSYMHGQTDEFIEPTIVLDENGQTHGGVANGDGVIFFNYRADRAKQITRAFIEPDFKGFIKNKVINNIVYLGMTHYDSHFDMLAAFPPENLGITLGRVLAENGLRQLRIAESEKFPHVTYFFNGGRLAQFPGEDRIEIPSPKVATYDLQPEMSAYEVTKVLVDRINMEIYDFILLNLANGDMVGHTGVLDAGIKAVEVVDDCLGKIVNTTLSKGGELFITADHGNVEEMINLETGEVDTEHTTNPVPFIHVTKDPDPREIQFGILSDIAPTILERLQIPKPTVMTGRNLI